MSQPFEAHTADMRQRSQDILTEATSFRDQIRKVYNTIDEMLASNYSSPDAEAIARVIRGYKPQLDELATMIENYGEFAAYSANRVTKTQDSIVSGLRGGN